VAATTPEKIITVAVHPFLGLREYQARILAEGIGLPKEQLSAFINIAQNLYRAYIDVDATLAEVNPLVITGSGKLLAVDGKISLDDSALFRHTDLAELRDPDEEDAAEAEAHRFGLNYINLDGEIGCMVNGAGLAMATMDIVKFYGGDPANFLDVGGGAQADKVAAALRIILSDERVKAVLINIFGGITRCDEVARGILTAIETLENKVPFVVRLVGTNEEEGRRILAEANLITATSLADAAEKAVAAAKGESA
jgi:succinyl-CoA synthetase beta subunit